ncbi:carbohydrate kinase family protein [Faecalicoccus pleomorphus]|uniref:carbohydrate kinase family protein n=1 Tax=Faecalicoccus pleomorphus TaxID=1323 RepID=UPI0026EDE1B7|nr:sugar kinase [Faecalicoccus pleomorphus]
MEKQFDVLCVGAAVIDIPLQPVSKNIFDVESYPLQQISMTIGGDAINESTVISRLGHKTALATMVGDDAAGQYIIQHCQREGICVEGIRTKENIDTSINVGLVTQDGERTFVTNRNGSLWKMTIKDIDLALVPKAKILSLASFFNNPLLDNDALVKIFSKAKSNNMIITADMIKPRLNETLDNFSEALSYVDYFFPNFDEACLMTGESDVELVAKKLLSYGVKTVVIKIGKRGAYIQTQNQEGMIVPAMKGIKAIDTIGAGDNFASGFISGLLEGKSLKECGEYGNVTASIAIQSIGATTGVRNRLVFEQRMREYRQQYPEV